jgi:hypothetical protein
MDFASLAAILIGGITLLVLLVPLGLSPWVPMGLCAVGMGLTVVDFAILKGRTTQYLLDHLTALRDPNHHRRLAYHESGHLLVGYVQGLEPLGYSVGVSVSAVEFAPPSVLKRRAYGVTLMAGGVAEVLFFEEAKGGQDDLAKLRVLLQGHPQRVLMEREYCQEATRILQHHQAVHETLAQLMLTQAPFSECLNILTTQLPAQKQEHPD